MNAKEIAAFDYSVGVRLPHQIDGSLPQLNADQLHRELNAENDEAELVVDGPFYLRWDVPHENGSVHFVDLSAGESYLCSWDQSSPPYFRKQRLRIRRA